ncbi:MAG: endolytic transglycosylase MltG [Desulfovibrio sp.]|nr:endolytic transglycosylase MltG [Desulfovibrio sp.]
MKKLLLRFTSCFFFLLFAGAAGVFYIAYNFLTTPASGDPHEFVLSIEPGSGFDRVAYALEKEGAIRNVELFRLLARVEGSLGKVRAGEYLISTGWTPRQVLRQITLGRALLHRLTVREGLPWWETARLVEEEGLASFDDFRDVIHDPEFLAAHSIPFANAEGFLFPETYLMNKPHFPTNREDAYIVASRMVKMFWKKTEDLWKAMPVKNPDTPGGAVETRTDGGRAGQSAPDSPDVSGNAATGADAVRNAPKGETGKTAAEAGKETAPEAGKEAAPEGDRNARPQTSAASSRTEAGAEASGSAGREEPGVGKGKSEGQGKGETLPARARAPARAASGNGSGGAQKNATSPDAPGIVPASPAEVDETAIRVMVVLGSMVERETRLDKERDLVAGVFANRLRLGMLMQCDPTVIYGMGESFSGSLRRSHLDDTKNIYNTYQHYSLPPGPICSPGLEALKAAVSPARHDFLYFVATGVDGGHSFSKTLGEHNRAVQQYRERARLRR